MGELTSDKPKCMVELYNGETILERQIRILKEQGITDFIITTGPYPEQLKAVTDHIKGIRVTYVPNPQYGETNYIMSMHLAGKWLEEDILLLHGDLVFNQGIVKRLLQAEEPSLCIYNEKKELPPKDFKGRFRNGMLKEVSVHIFDDNCMAFQPFYKLCKKDLMLWKEKVAEFIKQGNTKVYAEDALNQITEQVFIPGLSYAEDYVEEIDNAQDYERVCSEIKLWDAREQQIGICEDYGQCLQRVLEPDEKVFVVCSKRTSEQVKNVLNDYDADYFCGFSSNPKYEEIETGAALFFEKKPDVIVAVGGGSAIDTAKCIKEFAIQKSTETGIKRQEGNVISGEKKRICRTKLVAVPTTAGTGSESTQIAVLYRDGVKQSVDRAYLLPDVAVLDPHVLCSLPDYQKKATLLDALCQGMESYWAKNATEESREYAKKCISLILRNYQAYLQGDEKSYKEILQAANYSGKAIQISRTTAAHAMSYKLTSLYGISHGHAVALCIIPIWKHMIETVSKPDIPAGNIPSEETVRKKNILRKTLSELAELTDGINLQDGVARIEGIVKECQLDDFKIAEKDIPILVQSVDLNRMQNHPVDFSREEIEKIYAVYCH